MTRDDTEVTLLQFETENGEPWLEDDGTPVEVTITASERAMLEKVADDEGITFENAVIMTLENAIHNQQQIDDILTRKHQDKSVDQEAYDDDILDDKE